MGGNPLNDPRAWMNDGPCEHCDFKGECQAGPGQTCRLWRNASMNDPMVPRRSPKPFDSIHFADTGRPNAYVAVEVIYPRPKPRTALARAAEQHNLRFYLRDRMKAAEDRRNYGLHIARYRKLQDEPRPRRSEDGPHADYFRLLKAEREERLGRIQQHEEPA